MIYLWESSRLYGRIVETRDKPGMMAAMEDWPLARRTPADDEWAESWIEDATGAFPVSTSTNWCLCCGVFRRRDDAFVGLMRVRADGRSIEWLTSAVVRQHRGDGYYTEMCDALSKFLMDPEGAGADMVSFSIFDAEPQSAGARARGIKFSPFATSAPQKNAFGQALTLSLVDAEGWSDYLDANPLVATAHYRNLYPSIPPAPMEDA